MRSVISAIQFVLIVFISILPILLSLGYLAIDYDGVDFSSFEDPLSVLAPTLQSALTVFALSFVLSALPLRQLVYLFPYRFQTRKNLLLLIGVIACLIAGIVVMVDLFKEQLLEVYSPCPSGFLVNLFGNRPPTAAIIAILLVLVMLLSFILFRYAYKERFVSQLDLLYLRNFAKTPDRYLLRCLKRALPRKAALALVLPPRFRLGQWDPLLFAFSPNPLLPFKGLPLFFKESGPHWRDDIELFIQTSRCIVFEGSELAEGTRWELDKIRQHGAQFKTVVLIDSDRSAIRDCYADFPNIIKYQVPKRSIFRALLRTCKSELKKSLSSAVNSTIDASDFSKVRTQRRLVNAGLVLSAVLAFALLGAGYVLYARYPWTIEEAVIFNHFREAEEFAKTREGADGIDRCGASLLFSAIRNRNAEMVDLLLRSGADSNRPFEYSPFGTVKLHPLQAAVITGDTDVVEALLTHDANPNVNIRSFWSGKSALKLAIARRDKPIVRLLLEHNADPNDARGFWNSRTAIDLAVDTGDAELVELLISHGAHVGDAVIAYAVAEQKRATLKTLNAHREGERLPALTALEEQGIKATESGESQALREALEKGLSPDTRDYDGRYLINKAVSAGNVELAQQLVNNGANVHLWSEYSKPGFLTGTKWLQPLHEAILSDRLNIASLLLDAGASVSSNMMETSLGGRSYESPLYIASRKGNLQMVKLLLDSGAIVQPRKIGGFMSATPSPLDLDYSAENRAILDLLIANVKADTEDSAK